MNDTPLRFEAGTARRIKLVGLDVDGVLTDGMVYMGQSGDAEVELKRFDIRDNIGIKFLKDCGIRVVIISGRFSQSTEQRGRDLGVDAVIQDDGAEKLRPFERLLERYGVAWAEAAFMGDDLPDLPLLRRVGLAVTVQDAMTDVKGFVKHVTRNPGGQGAVREFCESLLRARDEWDGAVRRYLQVRGEHIPELTGT